MHRDGNVCLVADNVWIVDGPLIPFLAWRIPTRMTVIRLPSGQLWIHSPVDFSLAAVDWLTTLGPVAFIVAPNKFHHLFLGPWTKAYPKAVVFAAPGLRKKRPDITFHADLNDVAPEQWSGTIAQRIFAGNRFFDEVVFFHRPSATLILTDLIVNLRTETFSLLQRWLAQVDKIAYPRGETPVLFRFATRDRRTGRNAVEDMLNWRPKTVVISHGEWFPDNGAVELEQRMKWILT